MAKVKSCKN